jgi:hypothetical protein
MAQIRLVYGWKDKHPMGAESFEASDQKFIIIRKRGRHFIAANMCAALCRSACVPLKANEV